MPSTVEGSVPIRSWSWGDPVEPLAEALRSGGVAAIPSESSYGLAVDPGNPEAVERVYRLKTRDRGKPLLVVASDPGQLEPWVDAEAPILRWARRHWPAPLTVIVPLRRDLESAAGAAARDSETLVAAAGSETLAAAAGSETLAAAAGSATPSAAEGSVPVAAAGGGATLAAAAGSATLAVRIPAHDRLRALLDAIGFPVTATSANTSGAPPILDPQELVALVTPPPPGLSELWVVDDGVLPGGAPSTLVDWSGDAPRVLRQGAFDLEGRC